MPTFNGFEYYIKGTRCPHCKAKLEGDPEAQPGDYPEDFGDYKLQCPECYREGCETCMPLGRGCVCPECEDLE
jgi:hypothetical protein